MWKRGASWWGIEVDMEFTYYRFELLVIEGWVIKAKGRVFVCEEEKCLWQIWG